MNYFLIFILAVLTLHYIIDVVADWLNATHVSEKLPAEFEGVYDGEKYRRSQEYLVENTRFGALAGTVRFAVVIVFILAGGFPLVDSFARSFALSPISTGLIFTGILALATTLLSLPFSIYDTFAIEQKYGFNKTTPKTFALDLLKGSLLTIVIGGPVLAAIFWFFEKAGDLAWLYCWGALSVFQIFMLFISPYVIMPLFNKFIPLDEGELRTGIEGYCRSQDFKIKGVFKMDGSKRSTKSNAFFTGFGSSRRIVLFDTLIANHSVPELIAIIAHEMGHFKLGHIPKAIARSITEAGLTFFLLSLFIGNERLFGAFRMENVSVYAGLVFFGFLYTPISATIAVFENALSRRHEYEADAFAVKTGVGPGAMISALKKLSADNLTNLTPHPLKVMLRYSHPPILERIAAIRKLPAK